MAEHDADGASPAAAGGLLGGGSSSSSEESEAGTDEDEDVDASVLAARSNVLPARLLGLR
jgi:hypothetical protein